MSVRTMRAQIVRLEARLPRPPPKGGGLGGVDFSSLSQEQFMEIDLESLNIDQLDEFRAELRVRYKLLTGHLLTDELAADAAAQYLAERSGRRPA